MSQENRSSTSKKEAEELHARIRESDAAHKEQLADLRARCESEVRHGATGRDRLERSDRRVCWCVPSGIVRLSPVRAPSLCSAYPLDASAGVTLAVIGVYG